MADDRLYRVGGAVEAALADRWGHLLIDEAPDAVQPLTTEAQRDSKKAKLDRHLRHAP